MHMVDDWLELARNGRMVEAIKAYRASEGVDLAKAKSAVERWVDVNLPPPLDYKLAVRVAERLHLKLQGFAAGAGSVSYLMRVVSDRPDRHRGHTSLLAASLPLDRSESDVEVLFALSDVPKRIWAEEVRAMLASGVRLVLVVEVEFVEPAVTVYVNGGGTTVFLLGATVSAEAVLPGFSCTVAELFA